jgi:serine/threonine-protein kinase
LKRDAAEIAELSRLIDAALELPPEQRSTWIEQLPSAHDTLKPALRKLLAMPPAGNNTYTLSDVSQQVHVAMQGAAGAAEALEFKDGARVGPYELIRELGRGGMGTVWLARRTEGLTRRVVALKLPHPGMLHAEFAARMGRERDILESLAHPNIARLYDAGVTAAGQPYLALEYIEGRPLGEYCDEKQLGVRDRIRLFLQVLRAIQHAHSHLVIHRDLKPANILVTDAGAAVVLDFGIAKLTVEGATADTALTQFGGRALTPDFASPEQIAGQPLTTASDVYSLGVILYELLTGERPYKLTRGSAAALEEAILGANVRRPSQAATDDAKAAARATSANKLARTLRGELDTIVLTAMRVSLAERYRTVDALAQDIERYLDGRAISARPESWWEASRRFVVRHKLAVGSAAAVVLALSIGLGTALSQWRIAQRESENQKASKDFVIGLFTSVADNTPAGLSPADATAKQMLDIGTRQLFAEHSADSQVRLDLLLLMCSLNQSLGLLDTALKTADEAVALAARLYGETDLRYAGALEARAEVLVTQGENAQAIKIAERVLTVIGRATLENSELFAQTHILLGNAHNQIDPPESTVPREHLEAALKALKAAGSRSVDLSRANFYLARTWESSGEYTRAEPYYLDGIKSAEANFGTGSYIAAFGYDNFGDMLRHLHRYAEGEKYVRAAGATYRKLYGPQHANVAMTDMNLALILAAEGRRAEANKDTADALALAVATRGTDSFMTASFRMHQGRMKIAMGDFQEARDVIDVILTTLGKDPANHFAMLAASIDQARALILLDEQARARKLIDEISAAYAGTPNATSPRGVRADLRQGELQLVAGDFAGAREHFNLALDRALKLGESASDVLPETLFVYTQILPDAALARKTLASVESLPLIKTVRAGGTLSVDETIQLHTALGRLEQASGDLPAARKDLDEALRLRTAHDDPASPWLAQIQGMVAEQDAQAGDLPAARAALAQAELTLAKGKTDLPYFSKPLTELRSRLAKT